MDHGFFESLYTKRNCTTFVIAVGQWPLSFMALGGKPATVKSFHYGISTMVQDEKLYTMGNGDVKVYLQLAAFTSQSSGLENEWLQEWKTSRLEIFHSI
jgi:hypothetical protein